MYPLRLAVGSHQAGSGKGCAMNVISWENGDTVITDFPSCSDFFLARVVQRLNDTICKHNQYNFLCPPCSIKVLAVAHRTVGTALSSWSDIDRAELYVTMAKEAEGLASVSNSCATKSYADAAVDFANQAKFTKCKCKCTLTKCAATSTSVKLTAQYAAIAVIIGAKYEDYHRIIDRFYALTGLVEGSAPDENTVSCAVEKMMVKS